MTAAAPSPVVKDYIAIGLGYCEDVVDGRIVAGDLIRKACQRQLDDLARAHEGDPDFPYRFDCDKAERVCWFIETLPHIKGKWAKRGETLTLEPWQIFQQITLFGWVHVETGLRRFQTAYWEVARKNAKSTVAAAMEIFLATEDGEAGPEVYTAATKRDQAKIVFDVASEMLKRTPALRAEYQIQVQVHQIKIAGNGGVMKALDAKGSTQDGLNPHAAVNDEIHAWKGRALYEVIESAMGARDQPLNVNITTAGFDRSGICYELRSYGVRVLSGKVRDETFFPVIYTLDKDDDWTDESVWIKANPNLGVSVFLDGLRVAANQAKAVKSKRNGFLTKRMNVWCNAATDWLDVQAWDACAEPGLTLERFRGATGIYALDLATKKDIASRILWVEQDGLHYLFARHYCPEDTVESGENAAYSGWVEDGWLTTTPGPVIDQNRIKSDLTEDAQIVEAAEIVFDKWQGAKLMAELDEEGLTVVDLAMSVANMSEPMKELEALVLAGKVRHQGDPVLSWMMGNIVCFRDEKDNIFPRKDSKDSPRKIDAGVAAIMGMNRVIAHRDEDGSVFVMWA